MPKKVTAATRKKALALADEIGVTQAAKRLGMHPQTVSRWRREAKKAGASDPPRRAEPTPDAAPASGVGDDAKAPTIKLDGFAPVPVDGLADPAPKRPEQDDEPAREDRPRVTAEVTESQPVHTAPLVDAFVKIVDGRLAKFDVEPTSTEEKEALRDAWSPIVEHYLEDQPELVMAGLVTIAVYGPRFAEARETKKRREEEPPKRETRREPAAEEDSNKLRSGVLDRL